MPNRDAIPNVWTQQSISAPMAPPAKRQKRNYVASSNEAEGEIPCTTRTKAQLISLTSSAPPSALSSTVGDTKKDESPLPENNKKARARTAKHPNNTAPIYLPRHVGRANSRIVSNNPDKIGQKAKLDEKGKNGNLHTFFSKQVLEQQAQSHWATSTTHSRDFSVTRETERAAPSDVVPDDDVEETSAQTTSLVALADRKRDRDGTSFKASDTDTYGSSQKFYKKPRTPANLKSEDELRPWAERFGPINLEELAVHTRKVGDVRTWLEKVIHGKLRQRLLLLKGAAGTGKTITIQLLAKAMGCDLLEWRNPVGLMAGSDGFESIAGQFEEFMQRGGKFGQLSLLMLDKAVTTEADARPLDRRKQIILIEDFPNTFTRSSTALQSFRSTILSYLASNTPSLSNSLNKVDNNVNVTPVVMIISETLLTTSSAAADSFTAHRLLGPEIIQHPGVEKFEFNAIAPTLLVKTLQLVVQKESRKSGRKTTPGPLVLQKLGEIGDIRSAIGSLEFLCLRGDVDGGWGAKVAFGKTKRSNKEAVAMTRMEAHTLELVTRREATLGIFHAVGKVIYNKREGVADSQSISIQAAEGLPEYLAQHARPKKSQVAIDILIDEMGTDIQTFIAALHENYILSCDAPVSSFELTSLDHVNGCLDSLSDSDILSPSWGKLSSMTANGTTTDVLRQDEVSFQIAVRGLLFSLPSPVKRQPPPASFTTSRGGDQHKMLYPTSLKLWRTKREIESTLELLITRSLKGDELNQDSITAVASAFARAKANSVESWKNPNTTTPRPAAGHDKVDRATPTLSIGVSARNEMLLERLPYMTQLARTRKDPSPAINIKELKKITSFKGIDSTSDNFPDEADDGLLGSLPEWATDKPSEVTPPSKSRSLVMRLASETSMLPFRHPAEQRLVLSDDDIEDDEGSM